MVLVRVRVSPERVRSFPKVSPRKTSRDHWRRKRAVPVDTRVKGHPGRWGKCHQRKGGKGELTQIIPFICRSEIMSLFQSLQWYCTPINSIQPGDCEWFVIQLSADNLRNGHLTINCLVKSIIDDAWQYKRKKKQEEKRDRKYKTIFHQVQPCGLKVHKMSFTSYSLILMAFYLI